MTYEPQAMTLAMHIPDNFISPSTGALFWAIMIPIWVLCFRSVLRDAGPERMAYLGAGAAFSFLIMMFNVPTPGGTTAHGVGGALIALLLGPQYATVAVSVALLLQALLFGDGGLITLGANCFNMAVVLPFTAYGIAVAIRGVVSLGDRVRGMQSGRGSRGAVDGRDTIAGTDGAGETFALALGVSGRGRVHDYGRGVLASHPADCVAAFLGGYVGLTLASLCVAIELGVQPALFHDATGHALYFPFPLAVTIPAMLIPHLAVAGVVEGLVTVVVVEFVRRAAPEIVAVGAGAADRVGRGVARGGAVVVGTRSASSSDDAPAVPPIAVPRDGVSRETSARSSIGRHRPLWIALAIVALLSPLGLVATGDAWGEWGAEDFMTATGLDYVPQYIAHGFTWNALLPDYSLAGLPDIVGYLLSAAIGIAVTVIVFRLLAAFVVKGGAAKAGKAA